MIKSSNKIFIHLLNTCICLLFFIQETKAQTAIPGCTNVTSCNYNADATEDDGSCLLAEIIQSDTTICLGDSIVLSANIASLDSFPGEKAGFTYKGEFNGHYYYLSDTEDFWNDAKQNCNDAGGYMASITDEAENNYVSGLFGQTFYIGCSDQLDEGVWVWESGEPFDFANWVGGEPNNSGGQDYIQTNFQIFGGWDDVGSFVNPYSLLYVLEIADFTPSIFTSEIIWSTGDTTSTITVAPTETTTYTLTQTLNGVSCSNEVTITVQTSGCADEFACNYSLDAICEIDCVYALFENDCEAGGASCGPGQVWNHAAQQCEIIHSADTNFDGCVDLNDLMDILATYGNCVSICGNGILEEGEECDDGNYVSNDGCESCMIIEIIPFLCGDPVYHEGFNYLTVKIGGQCWFSENCRYLPSISISDVGDANYAHYYVNGYEGSSVEEAKATLNYDTYGVLYNHEAFITPGMCPNGWHVPSDNDWTVLTDFLGGMSVAGGALKTTYGWYGGAGSNSSGFSALPGGSRYDIVGYNGYWWASDTDGVNNAWTRCMYYAWGATASRSSYGRTDAFSARCVKDLCLSGDIPLGDCDCNGNQLDALGDCGGLCSADSDGDGICDDIDDCVGVVDECGVCNGNGNLCGFSCGGSVSYYGHEYTTIEIGGQCWFAENLRTSFYINGDSIPNVQDDDEWISLPEIETGAWCSYENNALYEETYGKMYNGYAVNDVRGLCPTDWHVSSGDDWDQMASFLGGTGVAGGKLKSTVGYSNNQGDPYGFSALPGGVRFGGFVYRNQIGTWRTSYNPGANSSNNREIRNSWNSIDSYLHGLMYGEYVRCVLND